MANVLIASLGESPIVVTSMVNKVQQEKQIQFDQVLILYPKQHQDIEDGITLIKEHCCCPDDKVKEYGLEFPDANTYERCFHFLQVLYGFLEAYQKDTVYLSLAGGRKSMSALMALLAPFYPNIQGLYHILDKHEGTKKANFYELQTLLDYWGMDHPDLKHIMNPGLDDLILVEIPFEHFVRAEDLRTVLEHHKIEQPFESVSVDLNRLSQETLEFWKAIFQKKEPPKRNEILLSQNAKEQFEQEIKKGSEQRANFERFFEKLKSPKWANQTAGKKQQGGKHVPFPGNEVLFNGAKMMMAERVVWYQDQNAVIVVELGVERGNGKYYKLGTNTVLDEEYFEKKSKTAYQPVYPLRDILPPKEAILVAAVGKSPMVVTQAYTLLKSLEKVTINKTVVIYPQLNGDIKNGVHLLEDVFQEKHAQLSFIRQGVSLEDIDSNSACMTFLNHLIQVLKELTQSDPDADIHLLLSGGRKGMTALSLFAAQHSHISQVYHTLIKDPDLEDKIEKDWSLERLLQLGSTQKKAETMFLETYSDEELEKNFALFRIPVIPLRLGAST